MNKFTSKKFLIFALNYIVGFGFIATIPSLINLGSLGLIVFAITSFITGVITLTFSKAVENFPNYYGGSYAYAKLAFKKNGAFFQGWNQLAQYFLAASTPPLFFTSALSEIDSKNKLVYQIVSVVIFILFYLINLFNLKVSARIVLFSSLIKWALLGIAFVLVVYLAIRDNNFYNNFLFREDISVITIVLSILTFIYAYGGIEGLANLAKDVKTKSYRKILLLAYGLILMMYLTFYVVLLGVKELTDLNFFMLFNQILKTTGVVLFLIGLLFNRLIASLIGGLVIARSVLPMAQDGYLPKFLTKANKNGSYKNAIFAYITISILTMIIFNIIPNALNVSNVFTTILNAGNIAFLFQYLMTIITILVLKYKKKLLKISRWEQALYFLGALLIAAILLIIMVPPIVGAKFTMAILITNFSYISTMLLGYLVWTITHWCNKNRLKKEINLSQ